MKKIRFIPENEYIEKNINPPQPAKLFLPEWYRLAESAIDKDTGEIARISDKNIQGGLKSCIPFLDAMISGYMMTTWEDIEITENDGENLSWRYVKKNIYTNEYDEISPVIDVIAERTGDIGHTIPRPAGHSINHLAINSQWGVRLPRGWSLMVTHPYNRFDLPFTTMAGFMDSDEFWTNGNIPFFIKKDWTGVIPSGTPYAQLIPIKRKSWYSYISLFSAKRMRVLGVKTRSVKMGYYKKNIWVRKEYN